MPDGPTETRGPNGGRSGWVPVPDPTVLTTQALAREMESVAREIQSTREFIELRFEGRHEAIDNQFDILKSDLNGLQQVTIEKFATVAQQLELVERQRVEQKKDTKDAVDAALTAQKEAVREQTAASEKAIAKSELAINKLLEQLAATFATAVESLRLSIDEVKERVAEVDRNLRESLATVDRKASQLQDLKAGAGESRGGLYAGLAALATVISIAVVLITVLTR